MFNKRKYTAMRVASGAFRSPKYQTESDKAALAKAQAKRERKAHHA